MRCPPCMTSQVSHGTVGGQKEKNYIGPLSYRCGYISGTLPWVSVVVCCGEAYHNSVQNYKHKYISSTLWVLEQSSIALLLEKYHSQQEFRILPCMGG